MPYLGNVPAEAYSQVSYQDLTGGSGTSFTLDYAVGSAGEIEVFVNNVRQEPTVAYTVNGTALTMTGSVAATDDFYIVFQGKAEKSGTIPEKQTDGTYVFPDDVTISGNITSTGIDDNATSTAVTIDSSGNVGIGTSSPDLVGSTTSLTINNSGGNGQLSLMGNGTVYGRIFADNATGDLKMGNPTSNDVMFYTANIERMRIDSSGRVGIGTSSPSTGGLHIAGDYASNKSDITLQNTNGGRTYRIGDGVGGHVGKLVFFDGTAGSARMVIDSSGNVLVGKTSNDNTDGVVLKADGEGYFVKNNGSPLAANRLSTDGVLQYFFKDTSLVGSIGTAGSGTEFYIGGSGTNTNGIYFTNSNRLAPMKNLVVSDNTQDIGHPSYRWKDAYITNGVTTGSDANEKQQIAVLTAAEIAAAKRISAGFKTFKWNDAVEAKGDNARTHTGVIAQEVQTALEAEGLDAGNYAFWMSNTWWETQTEVPAVAEELDEDGNVITEAQEAYTRTDTYDTLEEAPDSATERTRLGIRYPELLAFIGAATEQRLASIEARLEALETA